MPWLRPIITLYLCSMARSRTPALPAPRAQPFPCESTARSLHAHGAGRDAAVPGDWLGVTTGRAQAQWTDADDRAYRLAQRRQRSRTLPSPSTPALGHAA